MFSKYIEIIKSIEFNNFGLYNNLPKLEEPAIYIRHNVCHSLELASQLAKIEKNNLIQSNYFVLLRSKKYNLISKLNSEYINRINSYGHTINLLVGDEAFYNCEYDEKINYLSTEKEIIQNFLNIEIFCFSIGKPGGEVTMKDTTLAGMYNLSSEFHLSNFELITDLDLFNNHPSILPFKKNSVFDLIMHPYFWKNLTNRFEILSYKLFMQSSYINHINN